MLGHSIKRPAPAARMRCDAHLKPRMRARRRLDLWAAVRPFPLAFRQSQHVLLRLIERLQDAAPGAGCWASQTALAAELNISERWARECLRWLEREGFVRCRRPAAFARPGREATHYWVHPAFLDSSAWPLAAFQQLHALPVWGADSSISAASQSALAASAPQAELPNCDNHLPAPTAEVVVLPTPELSSAQHQPRGASFASHGAMVRGSAPGRVKCPADAGSGASGRGRSPRPPVVGADTGKTSSAGELPASASVREGSKVPAAAAAACKAALAGAGASSSPFAALAQRSKKSRSGGRSAAAGGTRGGDEPPAPPHHNPARVAAARDLLSRLAAWGAARWEICGGEREELAPGRTENKGWSCPPRPRRWSSGGLAIDSSARPVAVENLDLPAIDAWAAAGPRREIFMRPSRSEDHSIIFLDDVAADQIERFPCNWARAIFKTSANSHQVILRLPFAMSRADRTRAQRALIKLLNLGDPGAADGGQLFRVPFLSCNFKRGGEGFRTELVEFREGDPVEIELIEAGAGMDQADQAPAAPAQQLLAKKPAGTAGISESEKDWARVRHQLKRGLAPTAVIDELARAALSRGKAPTAAGCRAYAQRTVHKALESLRGGRR